MYRKWMQSRFELKTNEKEEGKQGAPSGNPKWFMHVKYTRSWNTVERTTETLGNTPV